MTDIEQRARELLKAVLQERYPNDVATRYVIKQLESDTLDLISCRAAVRAISAALREAPEGFVMVPAEPTGEMVSAAEEAYMPFGDMGLAIQMAIAARPQEVKDGE